MLIHCALYLDQMLKNVSLSPPPLFSQLKKIEKTPHFQVQILRDPVWWLVTGSNSLILSDMCFCWLQEVHCSLADQG